jgi:hypothetical protein
VNYFAMASLLERLDDLLVNGEVLVDIAPPVPFFGRLDSARVGTVGINPSDMEFFDASGSELTSLERRLPTLQSLGLTCWSDADAGDLRRIVQGCLSYFELNPYDRWFGALERLLGPPGVSFYGPDAGACHLDLVPFATAMKWNEIPRTDRQRLMASGHTPLAELIASSQLTTLILNGRSVVTAFAEQLNVSFAEAEAPGWHLHRPAGRAVRGVCFEATVSSLADIELGRTVRVLGYNHNLQSSFGVTSSASGAIAEWLRQSAGQQS